VSQSPPLAQPGQRVEAGPYRARSEQRWELILADDSRAVLGQLLPEAARDESLRRRFVYEAERLASLGAPNLAPILAIGPQPDPRDPSAEPPWRLRAAPPGRALDAWLRARAPIPVDRALALVADLADAVHGVHRCGAVLRDLEPRSIVLGEGGEVWLTDVGLARVDILSTRTASSLILEGSPYAAPEHLRSTLVDSRADIYTLGVILWQALTGTLPFGDGPAVLREHDALPSLTAFCPGAPAGLQQLLEQCLAEPPEQRPSSAREVAEALRGGHAPSAQSLERVVCQSCGEPLNPGLRLCLSCGKTAVQFHHVTSPDAKTFALVLKSAKEDAEYLAKLRTALDALAEVAPPRLDFVVGDQRMYSKEEREARIALPACLFRDLDESTARELEKRLRAQGFAVEVRKGDRKRPYRAAGKKVQIAGAAGLAAGVALTATVSPYFGIAIAAAAAALITGTILRLAKVKDWVGLARLRSAPAALPASDPLVARLAGLIEGVRDRETRARVGELALLVQRVCDHQAALEGGGSEADEVTAMALVTEPLEAVVKLVEGTVHALGRLETELAELDEGLLVRAIAASEARGEPRSAREQLLAGLDRLRALEDQRAAHMARLLEAGSLLRRIVDVGLDIDNPRRLTDHYTKMALAALGEGERTE